MLPEGRNTIVLKGEEADANMILITKGEFGLDCPTGIPCCRTGSTTRSLLLMAQFLGQLLLISLCACFGQIVFFISFVASRA